MVDDLVLPVKVVISSNTKRKAQMKDMDVNKVSELFRTIRKLKKDNADLERQRDELAAHVERAQRLADKDRVNGEFYDEDGDLREGAGWQSKLGRDLHAALKVTPATSLAAHDDAVRMHFAELAAKDHGGLKSIIEVARTHNYWLGIERQKRDKV